MSLRQSLQAPGEAFRYDSLCVGPQRLLESVRLHPLPALPFAGVGRAVGGDSAVAIEPNAVSRKLFAGDVGRANVAIVGSRSGLAHERSRRENRSFGRAARGMRASPLRASEGAIIAPSTFVGLSGLVEPTLWRRS